MNLLTLSLSVLFSTSVLASIFNGDDRIDFYQIKDESIKNISKSIPSLVPKYKLVREGDFYRIKSPTLHSNLGFCEDAPFAKEYQLANCSASLVGENTILTAAHCLDKGESSDYHLSKYYIVFDYKKIEDSPINKIKASDVYEIESMPYYNFEWDTMHDIAILK